MSKSENKSSRQEVETGREEPMAESRAGRVGELGQQFGAHLGAQLGAGAARWKAQLPGPMADDMSSVRRRAAVVGFVVLGGLSLMGWRAYDVSVAQHQALAEQGNRQQLRTYTLEASRGNILDRSYLSLAVNDRVEKVILNPRQIRAQKAEDHVESALVELFGEEHRPHIRKELARDKAYRKLRVAVDDDQAAALRKAALPGVRLGLEPLRVYPRGRLGAHVVGRVNAQGQGNLGVELGMDEELRGRDTSSPAYFASHRGRGRKLLVDGHPDSKVSRGNTAVLTVDSALQAIAEEEIDTLVKNWHPVGASVVVLDPKSGEVLAMTNRPTFDPNHRVQSVHQTSNLAVQHAYEPGSTMKAVTVAAALEMGTIRRNQTFDCMNGKWQYTPRYPIRDTHPAQWLDVTEIIAASSNICTTKIYETLGKRELHRWVKRFHFGERPAIQLPGATRGLLAPWEKWSDIQAANISFGQGMSASPIQVAAAFATLANGGVYNPPTMVREILDDAGEVLWKHEAEPERVVRSSTADTMMEMLTAVVHTKLGTGKKARIPGYRVAGKTSTAQKANPKGGYFEDQYYASFVGAVPAEDPKLVILVSVDNPEGGHYGNEVAAPTFSRVGGRALAYLGVPESERMALMPEVIALAADAPELTEGFAAEVDIEPSLPGQRAVQYSTGMPDFTGLTMAQALAAADKAKVVLKAQGSGLAVAQDKAPGPVEEGEVVTVHFASAF